MFVRLAVVTETIRSAALPRATLVTSAGCHFCEDAHEALAGLAAEGRVTLEVVDAGSPSGEALIRAHRPALFPLVLLDGGFFSAGRLPRRKLAKLLTTSAVTV